jgi:hypothetical protein
MLSLKILHTRSTSTLFGTCFDTQSYKTGHGNVPFLGRTFHCLVQIYRKSYDFRYPTCI